MKNLILVAAFMLVPNVILASPITAKINGMVCAFCAQGIEKKFKSEASVKEVEVDLDAKTVKVDLKAGATISGETVKKIIVDAGYKLESIDGLPPNKVADTKPN